jgi:hypothetical protein
MLALNSVEHKKNTNVIEGQSQIVIQLYVLVLRKFIIVDDVCPVFKYIRYSYISGLQFNYRLTLHISKSRFTLFR